MLPLALTGNCAKDQDSRQKVHIIIYFLLLFRYYTPDRKYNITTAGETEKAEGTDGGGGW